MPKVNVDKIVNERVNYLESSNKRFIDIINGMFLNKDWIFSEDNDGYKIYKHTFGEVYNSIINMAYSINQKYSDLKDQYIGLAMDNKKEFIISMFAIIMSGNKPYLVNLRHPEKLVSNLLNTLNIKYIIGDNKIYDGYTFIDIKELDLECASDYKFNPSDEIALSTSATSMNEKIVFFTGAELSAQILNCKDVLKENKQVKKHYKNSLKQLAFLPLYHIFGLVATFFWFSYFGRTIVFLNDYSKDTILYTIRRHEVTHIFAVPLFWNMVEKGLKNELKKMDEKTINKFHKGQKLCLKLQHIFPNYGIDKSKKIMHQVTDKLFGKSVQFMISGGAYINDETLRLFNSIGYPLYNGYGMTEIGITSVELGDSYDRIKNSIGKPFKSITYKIENNTLYVKGDSISHKIMVNGKIIECEEWFNTKDICHADKDNRYYIDGRLDDLIILENGENVNPDVIEKEFVIDKAKAISVISYDGKLSLIVSIDNYLPNSVIEDIYNKINNINNKLNISFRVSNVYFTYDEIMAKTAIKVSREYLKRKLNSNEVMLYSFEDIIKTHQEDIKVNSVILNRIKELISNNLGIELDTINDESDFFFDLGGTSLDYFSLIASINDEYNVSIPFENDSMHKPIDIAKVLEETLRK